MPHTLTWQEQGQTRQAPWRNTAAQKPPAAIAVAEADQVFCYGGGVEWDVAAALAPLGGKLHTGNDFDAFVKSILSNARSGDHILVMSNGGFGGIHQKLLDGLARE